MDVAASHPELVRRLLSSLWDDKAGNWKRGEPPMLEQGGAMQAALEVKSNLRKNLLLLAVQAKDPVLAKEILDAYIERLNVRVLQAIIQDADSNRVHLERRLAETHDPEVQSRMLSIMASEFARSQLVFNRVFEVIEKPILLDQKKGPRRKNIVVVATMLGILAGLLFSYLRPVRAMILDFLGSSRD
jgi:uncharacterized protein involved in exopolysaccharide biosynthesis